MHPHMLLRAALVTACFALALPVHAQSPQVGDLGLLPGDDAIASATSSQQEHAVARGGSQYLVVWTDYRGSAAQSDAAQSGGDLFGIRLDSDGTPVDAAPFLVAGGMGLQRQPKVAWNGSAWLVLYISQDPVGGYYEDQLRAVRVSAAGVVLDATPITFPPTQYTPNTIGLTLAGLNGQWLVTRCLYHADGYGTYLAGERVSGAGALLDATPRVLVDWIYGATVALTANGEYLVAGPDWNNAATFKARRVDASGTPIGAAFAVPSLTIGSSGSEYYVTWVKNYTDLAGSRMNANGVLTTPAGTTLVPGFGSYSGAALAHDGTQWWLEWGAADQLHTVRISAAGTALDAGGGPLLPITIGGTSNQAYAPVLVSRAGGGVHLLWYDSRVAMGYDANVYALPIAANNTAGTERCVSTARRNQRTPDFAGGPSGRSAVVFVSEAANDARVLLHLLDASGRPLENAPIEVASGTAIGRASVAWNGSIYLVTWNGGSSGDPAVQVKARRVNADGSFVDAAPFDVMPGFSPDVEALGDDFLIAASRVHTYPQYIYAWMRIVDGPTGSFVNAATLIGGNYVSSGPRVKQDGTRWVVTYHSHWSHNDSRSDVVYQFVQPNGSFTSPLNPSTTSGDGGTPDVAFSGSKYLFVWRNNTLANANNFIAGRLMNGDGTFAGPKFTIAEATGRQLRPAVAWDGEQFVVAWEDQRNQGAFFDERTDVYGARVSEAGVLLDPNGFAIHAGPEGDATPALIAHPGGATFVAMARFETTAPLDAWRIGLTSLVNASALDVDDSAPVRAELSASAPNPFRAGTTIAYRLARTEAVALTIHDLQGRLVRTLERGSVLRAGAHSAAWDGTDDSGARVAPGVYLSRLSTPSFTRSRRVVALER